LVQKFPKKKKFERIFVTGNEKQFDVLHFLEESNRTVHCPVSRVCMSLDAFAPTEFNSIFSDRQPRQYSKFSEVSGTVPSPYSGCAGSVLAPKLMTHQFHLRDVPVVW
jgi:hypothetical protein